MLIFQSLINMSNQLTQFCIEIGTLNLDCFEEYGADLRIDFTLTQLNEDVNLLSDYNSLAD